MVHENAFLSLGELSKRCESLDENGQVLPELVFVVRRIYSRLSSYAKDRCIRYEEGEYKLSRYGISLLAVEMPRLFTWDDLQYLLLAAFDEEESMVH